MIPSHVTLATLEAMSPNTLVEHLGIEYTEVGTEHITARMPVDHRTHQPFGMLHGGASVALAETLGSVAANLVVDPKTQYCVGLDINANHVKAARDGWVYGTTRPLHVGRKTQVWEIRIENEKEELISICRLTMAVMERK